MASRVRKLWTVQMNVQNSAIVQVIFHLNLSNLFQRHLIKKQGFSIKKGKRKGHFCDLIENPNDWVECDVQALTSMSVLVSDATFWLRKQQSKELPGQGQCKMTQKKTGQKAVLSIKTHV